MQMRSAMIGRPAAVPLLDHPPGRVDASEEFNTNITTTN